MTQAILLKHFRSATTSIGEEKISLKAEDIVTTFIRSTVSMEILLKKGSNITDNVSG